MTFVPPHRFYPLVGDWNYSNKITFYENCNKRVHLKMGSEDFIDLPAFGVSEDGNEDNGLHNSNSEQSEADGQPGTSPVIDSIPNIEKMGQSKGVCATEDDQHSEEMDLEEDAIQEQLILQESTEVAATITTIEKINGDRAEPASENICTVTLDDGVINRDQREGSRILLLVVPYMLFTAHVYS